MHLVQLFLPLHDNDGERFPASSFVAVRTELAEAFGGYPPVFAVLAVLAAIAAALVAGTIPSARGKPAERFGPRP